MAFDNLLLDRDDGVAVVTVNRPQVLNALNRQTLDELRQVVLDVKHDERVRAVILTGAGEKAFVAGADIKELATLLPVQGREHAPEEEGRQPPNTLFLFNSPRIASAIEPPSNGSVPVPNSSIRISVFSFPFLMKNFILIRWELYVLRSLSMLCSSPISIRMFLKIPVSDPSATGIVSPHCSIY